MVKVYTKDGSAFHEPPYTEQEHLDLQRWMNGGVVRFSSLQHPRQPKKPEKVRPEMKVHNLYRAELGHQRMPQYYSGGTIPKCDIKPDAMYDLIAVLVARNTGVSDEQIQAEIRAVDDGLRAAADVGPAGAGRGDTGRAEGVRYSGRTSKAKLASELRGRFSSTPRVEEGLAVEGNVGRRSGGVLASTVTGRVPVAATHSHSEAVKSVFNESGYDAPDFHELTGGKAAARLYARLINDSKRDNLAPFAGKRVRLVCLHSGAFRRHVRIGAVGEAQTRKTQRAKKADKPKNLRPPRPRLLGQDELVSTPHLLARFTGVWTRMGHRYAHGLRLQAAVWYARRFREWTGSWPQGTHEFIIKYGPTDEFEIRTPCGGKEGYCEIRLHFEARPAGAAFVEGDAEVGFNWFAMPIHDLLEGVN